VFAYTYLSAELREVEADANNTDLQLKDSERHIDERGQWSAYPDPAATSSFLLP
jgi:hypothetical protein